MSSPNKKSTMLANLGLFMAALMWGTSFTAVKTTLTYVPTLYILALRFTAAAVILFVVFYKRIRAISLKNVLISMGIGLVLLAGNSLQTAGCNLSTAGKTAFITTLYAVLVPVLNWLLYKKRPKLVAVIAALLALGGIALISLDGSGSINTGDLLVFISGVLFAVHIVLISRYAQEIDPFVLTAFQMAANAIAAWCLAPFVHGKLDFSVFTPKLVLLLAYLTLFCTLGAFVLQNLCLKYTSASTGSLICSLESVFGILFSMLLLKERPTAQMYVGFALVFLAVVLATTYPDLHLKRKPAQAESEE